MVPIELGLLNLKLFGASKSWGSLSLFEGYCEYLRKLWDHLQGIASSRERESRRTSSFVLFHEQNGRHPGVLSDVRSRSPLLTTKPYLNLCRYFLLTYSSSVRVSSSVIMTTLHYYSLFSLKTHQVELPFCVRLIWLWRTL